MSTPKISTPPAAAKAATRLPGLDLLRLGAALLVVIYHYAFRGGLNDEFLSFSLIQPGSWVQYFYFGVQLFFIISGFVILWSAENKQWLEFGIARFIRLWPAYFICVTLTALTIAFSGNSLFQTSVFHWLTNLTFFAPAFGQSLMDGVYWTIVLELIFYFWVVVALWTKVLPRFVNEFCLGWMLIIVANEFWLQSGILEKALITRFGAWFIIGILMYSLWSRGRSLTSSILLVTAIAMSMNMAVLEHFEAAAGFNYAVEISRPIIANIFVISLAAVTISLGNRIPGGKLAYILGGLTYPLYLVHQNAGYLIIENLRPHIGNLGAVLATAGGMLVLSALIFWGWERPIGRILKRGGERLQLAVSELKWLKQRKTA